jgi:hypothetical protein
VTVAVTVAVVIDGTVTMLVTVLGGLSPPGPLPGVSGRLLSLCWEPMNRPMKVEKSRRKMRRRMSSILLRGVRGSWRREPSLSITDGVGADWGSPFAGSS